MRTFFDAASLNAESDDEPPIIEGVSRDGVAGDKARAGLRGVSSVVQGVVRAQQERYGREELRDRWPGAVETQSSATLDAGPPWPW